MPSTAAGLKDVGSGLPINPYDPGQNLEGGAEYLSQLLANNGGDYNQALLSYKGAVSPAGIAAMQPIVDNILAGQTPSTSDSGTLQFPGDDYGTGNSPKTGQTPAQASASAKGTRLNPLPDMKWLSLGTNIAFVLGGLALIVGSIYTAMHGTGIITQASSHVKGMLKA
jgi:hypothetical protein